MKHAVDYLGEPYFPEYRGCFAGEFPHMAITRRAGNVAIKRMYFSHGNFRAAWDEACEEADRLNAEHRKEQSHE